MSNDNPFGDLFVDDTEPQQSTYGSPSNPIEDLDLEIPAEFQQVFPPIQSVPLPLTTIATVETPEVDIDLDDLELATANEPLTVAYDPISGELLSLLDVATVVRKIIETKALLERIEDFEKNLKRAALGLTTGKTKTRRLSAEVDGTIRTLQVHLPDDDWPGRELSALSTWCNDKERKPVLGQFAKRFIR